MYRCLGERRMVFQRGRNHLLLDWSWGRKWVGSPKKIDPFGVNRVKRKGMGKLTEMIAIATISPKEYQEAKAGGLFTHLDTSDEIYNIVRREVRKNSKNE